MIKIENVVLPSAEQWEAVIRGMRNPMNSWDKMDSEITFNDNPAVLEDAYPQFFMGDADYELAQKLADGGSVHAKYRRMIPVYLDITAPLYWWKEFDTYKVGTVANSCSTMHKIAEKEFTLDDFSTEHLYPEVREAFENTVIKFLNEARKTYNFLSDVPSKKDAWWQMIQLLPTSYNQKRTVMLNYEVLANIYKSRRHHKLDCWHTLCDFIEELPYSELITGEEYGVAHQTISAVAAGQNWKEEESK